MPRLLLCGFIMFLSLTTWAKKTTWYVALDPGHGGKNYGAIDPREEGRYEKHYTLQIVKPPKFQSLELQNYF